MAHTASFSLKYPLKTPSLLSHLSVIDTGVFERGKPGEREGGNEVNGMDTRDPNDQEEAFY